MAKKRKLTTTNLSPEQAFCSKVMTEMFDGIYRMSSPEEFCCTDDHFIKITKELAVHLYDHCGYEFNADNDKDKEAWAEDITGQYMYVSHRRSSVTKEELMQITIPNLSSYGWDVRPWSDSCFDDLYWWADTVVTEDTTMFYDYHWKCMLISFGLIRRMVQDGEITLQHAWDMLNEKKKNGDILSFDGWCETPMPTDLTLDNFMHYVFKDIFDSLYANRDQIHYTMGMENEYFRKLTQEHIDKYLEKNSDDEHIKLADNLGKYVYLSWGGDSFTDDEMRSFYEWNGLVILTEDLLIDRYKELPAYVMKGRGIECSNFQGADFVDYMIVVHRLSVLNMESEADFLKRFDYINTKTKQEL